MSHRLAAAAWARAVRGCLAVAVVVLAVVVPPLASASSLPSFQQERLLILGDSIAQGTAGDVTWRAHLWRSLQASPSGRDVDLIGSSSALFNVAINRQDGNRSYADQNFDQDHESVWATTLATVTPLVPAKLAALPAPPTVIVVALGTNDAPGGTAKALGAMRRLIGAARASAPGVDLVLQVPYMPVNPSTGAGINIAYTQSFATGLASLATELDTAGERVVLAPTTAFDARRHTWDGSHPNSEGELVLARATAEALAQLGIGDGPVLPESASWPQTGPRPTVTFNGPRATVTWTDATPGALAYALEQRRASPGGSVTPWTLVTQPARTVGAYTTPTLTVGDVYAWRLTPVRGSMRGRPGMIVGGVAPAPPPPAPRPWWRLW